MALSVVTEDAGGVKVIKCAGYIDSENSGQIKTVIEDLIREGSYKMIMDLGRVDYVSSAGWGLFVGYLHEARNNKGDIKIADMKKEVLEIFELLDFVNIFQYFRNVTDAVKAF